MYQQVYKHCHWSYFGWIDSEKPIAHGYGDDHRDWVEKVNLCRNKEGEVCPYDLSHDKTVESMRNALLQAQAESKLRKYTKGRTA